MTGPTTYQTTETHYVTGNDGYTTGGQYVSGGSGHYVSGGSGQYVSGGSGHRVVETIQYN